MKNRLINWLLSLKAWHYLLIGCITSEILTFVFSTLFAHLFYDNPGDEAMDVLYTVGIMDAFAVAFIVVGLILLLKNIYESRIRESEQHAITANKAKDAFLANMSHEIRTPLTAIIGFAEYSLDSELSEADRMSSLRTIVNSGNHLLNIINDILDFSKIEADSIDVELLDINPVELAASVQSLVMQLATKKQLAINLEYEFPVPSRITTDPLRLKQILINVCSNAIKFTGKGSITLVLAFDQAANNMIFRIRDTGIGMNQKQLEKIFDPFKQADSSITRRYGGTGLGLSLSKRLAELLGGTLTASSTPGQGSEFLLRINAGNQYEVPLLQNSEQIVQNTANSQNNLVHARLKGSVLLAEDNPENQQLFKVYLNKMGIDLTVANNGAEAVEHVRQKNFDLVLMDMQMPVMSGIDAVIKIRAAGYSHPISALTANATKEDRQQCIDAGFNDFVTKPISRDRLYQAVASYLPVDKDQIESTEPLVSRLLEEDPEFEQIVVLFVNSLPDMLDAISRAYHKQDWPTFKKQVHSLKGTGGGVGYPQVTELCADMEKFLVRDNYLAIEDSLTRLANLVVRIKAGARDLNHDLLESLQQQHG